MALTPHREKLLAAIKNPNATEEHISKALNDEDFNVKYAATKAMKR